MVQTLDELPENASGRERLLAAAVPLFAAKGYAATSVRDILRAAGVTAPVLYYHFGSKEGLFLALAHEGRQRFDSARDAALRAPGTVVERIHRLAQTHLAKRREYAGLSWVVEQILSGPPEAAPPYDFRAAVLGSVRRFEALVEEGTGNGELACSAPRDLALALLGAVEVASRPHLYALSGQRPDAVLTAMLDQILSGIAARPAGRGRRAPRRAHPKSQRPSSPRRSR